ncbi:cytochrome b5-like heme/steroid binding domain-containing protein [Aspergillus unguis]
MASRTLTAVVQPEPTSSKSTTPESIPIAMDRIYTKDELHIHNQDGDLWLAIDGTVYDLTKFSEEHPGGKKILLGVAGTDASKKYRKYHGDNILQRQAKEYKIGTLKEGPQKQSKGILSLFRKK